MINNPEIKRMKLMNRIAKLGNDPVNAKILKKAQRQLRNLGK